jgi:hypothetical protein
MTGSAGLVFGVDILSPSARRNPFLVCSADRCGEIEI